MHPLIGIFGMLRKLSANQRPIWRILDNNLSGYTVPPYQKLATTKREVARSNGNHMRTRKRSPKSSKDAKCASFASGKS